MSTNQEDQYQKTTQTIRFTDNLKKILPILKQHAVENKHKRHAWWT